MCGRNDDVTMHEPPCFETYSVHLRLKVNIKKILVHKDNGLASGMDCVENTHGQIRDVNPLTDAY